ncbi:Predicted transcriptional regulator [Pseudomonas aeruginosa]|nr:Predicted transcriptional regulator [Pseudomonas aeruginosa]
MRLIRLKEVMRLTGLGRSTVYKGRLQELSATRLLN